MSADIPNATISEVDIKENNQIKDHLQCQFDSSPFPKTLNSWVFEIFGSLTFVDMGYKTNFCTNFEFEDIQAVIDQNRIELSFAIWSSFNSQEISDNLEIDQKEDYFQRFGRSILGSAFGTRLNSSLDVDSIVWDPIIASPFSSEPTNPTEFFSTFEPNTTNVADTNSNLWTIIGSVIGGTLILAVIIFLFRRKISKCWREASIENKQFDNPKNTSHVQENNYIYQPTTLKRDAYKNLRAFELREKDIQINKSVILGQGEFGQVFSGIYKPSKTPIAIKITKTISESNFIAEAEIGAKLKGHANVMSLFGAIFTKGSLKLVYSLMEKGDLHNLLKIKTYTQKQLLSFMSQTLSGLEFIHKIPIIHGDLAARNLLIDAKNCLKISDFGKSEECYQTYNYYQGGSAKGNIDLQAKNPWRWLPLELYDGGKLTSSCDIWAFGVTSWEMFTAGEMPYRGVVDFAGYVRNGFRLQKPDDCDMAIYLISKYGIKN